MWSVQSGTAFSAVGLTLSSTGTISGTPTGPETEATVVVQVTDSRGNTATQGYLLTINNASTGPAMVSDSETITVNDSDVVQVIDVNDSETITVTDKVSVAVVGAAAMTLTASPASPSVNSPVTLIATISPNPSGPTVPSGNVAFALNDATLTGCGAVPVGKSGNADRRFAGQCPRTRTGAWECRAAHLHVAVAAAQPRTGVPQAAPWRLAHARCTAFPHRNRKLYCVRRQRLL